MNWRLVFLVCTLVAAAVLPSALASEGIRIWWITEPVMNPDPVESGGMADVSFDVGVLNRPDESSCRDVVVTQMYGFPVCIYLLQWVISLDDDWLAPDSTPIGTGFAPYVRSVEEENTITTLNVTERVHLSVEPGTHSLHVRVNWIASVPISSWHGALPDYNPIPCGLDDHIDLPVIGCDYDTSGWKTAPVIDVEVLPGSTLNMLPSR